MEIIIPGIALKLGLKNTRKTSFAFYAGHVLDVFNYKKR